MHPPVSYLFLANKVFVCLFVVIKVKSQSQKKPKMTSATEFLLKLTWILQESMT